VKFVITWSASDADFDTLTYSVGYKIGGTDWTLIASSLTETSYVWNITGLSDTSEMRIKVSVYDGYGGSADDQSDYTFSVDNPDYVIKITSPRENDVKLTTQVIKYEYEISNFGEYTVDVYLNNEKIEDTGSLGTLPEGIYFLRISAQNNFQNIAEAEISFKVLSGSDNANVPKIPSFLMFPFILSLGIGIALIWNKKMSKKLS